MKSLKTGFSLALLTLMAPVFFSCEDGGNGSGSSSISKIAFTSLREGDTSTELYVMDADGKNQTKLTDNWATDRDPAWSPNGDKILFSSNRDDNHELYVMNADGTNTTRLTDLPNFAIEPEWSPDGQKIAFMSQVTGTWPGLVFLTLIMDSTGDNLEELPFPPPTAENRNREDGMAVWSPDSERMAFASNRDGQFEIYVMDRDGSNQTNLTNNSATDYRPSWSRDGTRIAFVSWRDNAQHEQIYVMDADGTNTIRLSDDTANDTRPSWSPDGTQLAFASDRDENWEIYVMDADGSNLTNITQSPGSDSEPAWGP